VRTIGDGAFIHRKRQPIMRACPLFALSRANLTVEGTGAVVQSEHCEPATVGTCRGTGKGVFVRSLLRIFGASVRLKTQATKGSAHLKPGGAPGPVYCLATTIVSSTADSPNASTFMVPPGLTLQ
jgi:hypothetical protein